MMRLLTNFSHMYFYSGIVDFRKSIGGLSAIVEKEMNLNLFSDSLFIFISKNRTKIKLLYWDKTGFALWQKTLEEENFKIPKIRNNEIINLNSKDLERLLEGFDIFKIKPHKMLNYSRIS